MAVGGVGGHMVYHGSRLRTIAAALLPAVPAAAIVALDVRHDLAVLVLLLCVLVTVAIDGLLAGVVAGVLAICGLHATLLWHHLTPRQYAARWPENLAFAAVVIVIVSAGGQVRRLARVPGASERRGAALTYQLELLAPVLDDAPIGLAIFGPDLRCRYVNHELERLHGRSAAHLVGLSLADAPPMSELRIHADLIREVMEKGLAEFGMSKQIRVGDDERHVLIGRYPVRKPGGDVTGVALAFVDITTTRKLAEIEAEAGQLRRMAELTHRCEAAQRAAGLSTWEVDLASGRRTCSDGLLTMLGVDRETFATSDASDYLHPADRDRVLAAFRRLLEPDADSDASTRLEMRTVSGNGRVARVLCTITVARDEDGRPVRLWGTTQDITDRLAAEAAHREAVAAAGRARAELAVERAALQMVQRALLPAEMPSIREVDLAVKYQPVETVADVGGDWYDAFRLPDGRLGVAVGDVSGHDVRAATLMGNVRNAVRAYAVEDPRPGRVLSRTNALLMALSDNDQVTAAFGVYDPVASRLTFARAGQPPPVVRVDGRAEVLVDPPGAVLGQAAMTQPYPEATVALQPGDAVLFYTDGLVERRGVDATRTAQRLRDVVDAIPRQAVAADIVAAVTESMVDSVTPENDVCLLVLRRP